MEDSFVSAVVILLLVTDPIGNIPLFVSLLRDVDPDRRVRVIVRECAIALAVLLICVPFGSSLLELLDRKSTRLNSSHTVISYAVFCLKKKKQERSPVRQHVRLRHR